MRDESGKRGMRLRSALAGNGARLEVASTWLALAASIGFFVWTVRVPPDGAEGIAAALGLYGRSLLIGLAAAAVAVLPSRRAKVSWETVVLVGYVSCTVYLGFVQVVAGAFVPWALLGAAAAAALVLRRRGKAVPARTLLLPHAMGTMSGLYMFFHLRDFLAPWPAFLDVLAALRLLWG